MNADKKPFRIFRVPGSRQFWHIDAGPGTPVINVLGIKIKGCEVETRDVGDGVPRAWFEVRGELFVSNYVAHFIDWSSCLTGVAMTEKEIVKLAEPCAGPSEVVEETRV